MLKSFSSKKYLFYFKHFLVFKKPVFNRFNFLDLVLQRNGYFLFTWSVSNAYWIKIWGKKAIFLHKSGIAFLKIPDNITEIKIITGNAWRSTKMAVRIKRLEYENSDFNSSLKLSIIHFQQPRLIRISSKPFLFTNRIKKAESKISNCQLTPRLFSINRQLLTYHPQNSSQND